MAEWAQSKNIYLIVDESFVDFVDVQGNPTLLDMEVLNNYKRLLVIKSISKSYGVPGLRLGLLASGDKDFLAKVKKDIAIWNINSFAEFFLQIFGKYKSDYDESIRKFKSVRRSFIKALTETPGLRVIDSQANYVTCEILPPNNSLEAVESLLSEHNILVRELSAKAGFDGAPYCRIAIKNEEENAILLTALHKVLK
jgi:histidinol-phosphate/aromatic aminotransferase/cobyric acid decarboxylase-like protein